MLHELGHRIQKQTPALDKYFVSLYKKRTEKEALKPLRELTGCNYGKNEVARKDNFIDAYWGKDYNPKGEPKPNEMLTMSMQTMLGAGRDDAENLKRLHDEDRETLEFVLALLTRWKP